MNIITGYRGEPHITAQEDRDINLGLVGKSTTELYVLDVGQQLEAEIVSANEVRVKDGVLVMQGCAASINYGTYDSLTISNGSQGMQRIDVIAAQYERDGDTNVETVSLVVIEGTPAASDPTVPSLTGGSIQGGDSLVQMPLYYVNLDGVSIDSIDAQFVSIDNLEYFKNTTKEIIKTGSAQSAVFSVGANATFSRTITVSPPNGYTFVGIIGFNSNHNQSLLLFSCIRVSDTSISCTGRNVTSSSFSDARITAFTLYVKNEFI